MRRGLLALGLVVTTTAPARADEGPEVIHLEYLASGGCPDRQAFEARVRAQNAAARIVPSGAATRTFEVRLDAGPPATGRLTVGRQTAVEGAREVRAESCADAADALALIVALAVAPGADGTSGAAPSDTATRSLPVPPPTVPPAPSTPSPASSLASRPSPAPAHPVSRDGSAPTPTPVARPAAQEAPAPASQTTLRGLSFGVDAAMASGVLPDWLAGVSPYVAWSTPGGAFVRPELRASFLRATSDTVGVRAGAATFTWTVGRLDACAFTWPAVLDRAATGGRGRSGASLSACARFEGGALDVAGVGVVVHANTRPWAAAGPLVRGRWSFLPPLFVEADIAPMVHLTDDRFVLLPDTTVHTVPLLGVDAAAGLGVHFLVIDGTSLGHCH